MPYARPDSRPDRCTQCDADDRFPYSRTYCCTHCDADDGRPYSTTHG